MGFLGAVWDGKTHIAGSGADDTPWILAFVAFMKGSEGLVKNIAGICSW
jgi:hypothetical protein